MYRQARAYLQIQKTKIMCYNKKCPNCKEEYVAGRIDQKFCSNKGRNALNNRIQAKINRPYQTIAKNLKAQDELLMTYAHDPDNRFHSTHFKKYGINIENAFRLYYDSSNQLSSVEFVKYKLVHIGNSIFKISKT